MAKGLRLTELYPSIQGEGPHTGEPTVFVRFGGCNMRCPGWPCDTQHAIEPSMWRNDPIVEVVDLLGQIQELPGDNICITGGEPTMQPAEHLSDLVSGLLQMHYTIDMFTNGSLHPFAEWTRDSSVCIIMDWKLKGSGEWQTGVELRLQNLQTLTTKDAIKFVIKDDDDFKEAIDMWHALKGMTSAVFWVGTAWGHYKEADLVKRVLEEDLPWKVNIQVHKYVWPGVEKGI